MLIICSMPVHNDSILKMVFNFTPVLKNRDVDVDSCSWDETCTHLQNRKPYRSFREHVVLCKIDRHKRQIDLRFFFSPPEVCISIFPMFVE